MEEAAYNVPYPQLVYAPHDIHDKAEREVVMTVELLYLRLCWSPFFLSHSLPTGLVH